MLQGLKDSSRNSGTPLFGQAHGLEEPPLKMVPQAPWPFELNGIPQLKRSYKRFAGIVSTGWEGHIVKHTAPFTS